MGTLANTMRTTSNILVTIAMTFYNSGSFRRCSCRLSHSMPSAPTPQYDGFLHPKGNLDDNYAVCRAVSKNYGTAATRFTVKNNKKDF